MRRLPLAFTLAILASIYINLAPTSKLIAAAPTAKPVAAARAPKPAMTAPPVKSTDACAASRSKFQHEQCEKYNKSAPGDEYFGRMKMSYLGINNTFHDQVIRAGAYTTDNGFISRVNFADESLRAWSGKYPHDPQLARSYYLAVQVFKKIYTRDAQNKAWQYMHIIVSRFPTSYFGKLEKKELQIGFTERYFALPLPCPTALPSGSPVNGLNTSPSPAPTDSPTPTPPGQPKVQIIVPPCVPPATPTPVPTVMPTTMPTPGSTPAITPTPGSMPTVLPSVSPGPGAASPRR